MQVDDQITQQTMLLNSTLNNFYRQRKFIDSSRKLKKKFGKSKDWILKWKSKIENEQGGKLFSGKNTEVEVDKNANIKISQCQVKGGLVPKKRIWGKVFTGKDQVNNKRQKCKELIYENEDQFNFKFLDDIDEAAKFSRNDNGDPFNFFTNEYCSLCNQDGNMLICENCPKVIHLKCIGLTKFPTEDFICPYCRGIKPMECAKCFKIVQNYEQIKIQPIPTPQVKTLQLIPAQCSMCLSQIHSQCLDVPLSLVLKGGAYYQLKEKDYANLLSIFESYQQLDPRQDFNKIAELKQKAKEILGDDEVLHYLCYVCQESRQIDVICDVKSLKKFDNLEEQIDFNSCYCLVKFKHTSYRNAIWVEYSTVESLGKTKLEGFNRKFKISTYGDLMYHQEAMKYEDYGDKFHNIEITYMLPFRIVDQFKHGKYFLVKWKNLDYTQCTWEPANFVNKHCLSQKQEYLRVLQTQDLINDVTTIGASYRFDLMKSRDMNPNLQEIQIFNGTPLFLNKANENMKLHEYQAEGLNWLIDSWKSKTNVILADEMGLGKTVQAISFISYLINVQQITRPFLVVVPVSTMENWIREFNQWCPEARVLPYLSGDDTKSRQICRELEFFYEISKSNLKNQCLKDIQIPKFNVLLTSYQFLVQDYKSLVSIPWKCVIIDEGQRLKSCDSRIFKQALTLVSEHRILLSGTPLQNNIGELFNLLEYLDPVKFNSEMRENFQKMFAESVLLQEKEKIFQRKELPQEPNTNSPSNSEQPTLPSTPPTTVLEGANTDNDIGKNLNIEKEKNCLDQLQTLLAPHILRRFKRDVLKNFPKKKEVILRVEMTQKQRILSKSLIEKNFEALTQFEKQKNSGIKVSLRQADNILTQLRMIANHPLHLTDLYGTEVFRSTSKFTDEQVEQQLKQLKNAQDYIRDSGKLQYLDKMMDLMFEKGHRILLFTQFRGTLDILSDYLTLKEVKYLRLDGETENQKRQKLIDLFNAPESEYKIFLLSTKAGGLGINLTSADTIVIFDSDFNPHNDVQALNRAHRIGQKNNVMVYRLICKHSVEERIIEAAKHKLMLDTMMTHSSGQKKQSEDDSNSLYQILKFGTKKLFDEEESKTADVKSDYVIDEQKMSLILDREVQFKQLIEEEKALSSNNDGVKDYLSGFKIASIEKKIEPSNQQLESIDSSSDDEDDAKDEDDKVFQRMMAQMKEKTASLEQVNQTLSNLKPVSINHGIITRNQRREVLFQKNLQSKANIPDNKIQIQTTEEEQKGSNVESQEGISKFYEMSSEYAQFIGQVQNGVLQMYHDSQLYVGNKLSEITSLIEQSSAKQGILPYHTNNQERKNRIKNLSRGKTFNKEFVEILKQNESSNLLQVLPFLKVQGFNYQNIEDFISAFMKFGVYKQDYQKLIKKIRKDFDVKGEFSSLILVTDQAFLDFSTNFQKFYNFIYDFMNPYLSIPQFLFAFNSPLALSQRIYNISLMRSFCQQFEVNQTTITLSSPAFSFDPLLDTYIFSKLILRHGYSNFVAIVCDPIWHLYNLYQQNLQLPSVKDIVKMIKRAGKEGQARIEACIYPELMRHSQVVLYQKLSGNKAEDLIHKLTAQGQGSLCKVQMFNEFCQGYCVERIVGLQEEVLKVMQNVDKRM